VQKTAATEIPMNAIGILAAGSIVGGVLVGALYYLAKQLLPIQFVSAMLGLLLSGLTMLWVVRRAKLRDRAVGVVFGVIMGMVAFGAMMMTEYLKFRLETVNQMVEENGFSRTEAETYLEQFFQENTGRTGIIGYFLYALDYGYEYRSQMTFFQPRPAERTEVLMFWGLDMFVLITGAVSTTWRQARAPFCEHCQRWYGQGGLANQYGKTIGGVDPDQRDDFIVPARQGDFKRAAAFVLPKRSKTAGFDVQVARCPTCDLSPIQLTVVDHYWAMGQLHSRVLLSREINRDDLGWLMQDNPSTNIL
jgi:hypothetical protein